jgi:hypothetical protein
LLGVDQVVGEVELSRRTQGKAGLTQTWAFA